MGILSAVKRGASAVQSAYNKQQVAAEERGRRRIENAKTQIAKQRARADLELERQKLKRELYEAQARVREEKAAVTKARRDAGGDWFDRAGKFLSATQRGIEKLGKPAPRRRSASRSASRKTAAKRTVRRKTAY